MKPTILFFSFLLFLPLAFASYGGETWIYHFDKCNELRINVTAADIIDIGEYTILNNCTENKTNHYFCDCYNDYYLNITFNDATINNYTFMFNYDYTLFVKNPGTQGGSSGSRSSRTTKCIPIWKCSDWSDCINGFKNRNCTSKNNCYFLRPELSETCFKFIQSNVSLINGSEKTFDDIKEDKKIVIAVDKNVIESGNTDNNITKGSNKTKIFLSVILLVGIGVCVFMYMKKRP